MKLRDWLTGWLHHLLLWRFRDVVSSAGWCSGPAGPTSADWSLCCSGGKEPAEERDGSAAQEVCGSDPDLVARGLEVQGDEDQAESCGALLYPQGEERRNGAPYWAATARPVRRSSFHCLTRFTKNCIQWPARVCCFTVYNNNAAYRWSAIGEGGNDSLRWCL